MSRITVREVRRGLYRIHWELDETALKKEFCKETFQLCGPLLLGAYTISCQVSKSKAEKKTNAKYTYDIVVEESSMNNKSKDVSSLSSGATSGHHDTPSVPPASKKQKKNKDVLAIQPSAQPLELENICPMYVWISGSSPQKKDTPLLKMDVNWQARMCYKHKREFLTIWMDFGTNSSREMEIADLFYKQLKCDVEFEFSDGKTIGAHILILSAGSPIFAALFQKSRESQSLIKVTIDDIAMEEFRQLLIYLYTCKVPKIEDLLQNQLLYEAAEKYKVVSLQQECVQALLLTRRRIESAISLLVWSYSKSITILLENMIHFVTENFRELCYRSEWLDVIKNHPELCLLVNQHIAGPPPVTVD